MDGFIDGSFGSGHLEREMSAMKQCYSGVEKRWTVPIYKRIASETPALRTPLRLPVTIMSSTPPLDGHLFQQPRGFSVGTDVSSVLIILVIVREPMQLKLIRVAHMAVGGGSLVVEELVSGRGRCHGEVEEDVCDWVRG
jgi:hypothetical protein